MNTTYKKIIIVLIILLLVILYLTLKIEKNNTLYTYDETIDWSSYTEKTIELTSSLDITEAGVYHLSGSIDGKITINTNGNVKLVLNDVNIKNENGSAITVFRANLVVIETLDNTTNTLEDGSSYENNIGTIYSNSNLVLEGNGTLIVNGNMEDAIVSKENLKINSGSYIISSKDDAIRGKNSVYIKNGNFNITSADGIKSSSGYVQILDGNFKLNSVLDGIQAESKITIENGVFNITTESSDSSSKGIKANDIEIINGTFNLNTVDDSIHANNSIYIKSGTFEISSNDDGIHADKLITIEDGNININKSYEGIEACEIIINGGDIKIEASDDGINAASKTNSIATLTINGGNIYVDAYGDGLDSNGYIYINGGSLKVLGPTNDGNGALDYDKECIIKGGDLLAIGSSGMAQGISSTSSQYGILVNLSTNYNSSDIISLVNHNDQEIFSYTATKKFSSVVYSSSSLLKDETYTMKINGEIVYTFTINSINTTVGKRMNTKPGFRR